jgi:hypothetical protein
MIPITALHLGRFFFLSPFKSLQRKKNSTCRAPNKGVLRGSTPIHVDFDIPKRPKAKDIHAWKNKNYLANPRMKLKL